jgi:zinc transporter 1/2/3
MANSVTMHKVISIIFILITLFTSKALADCESESSNKCNNKEKALPLKIISIFAILLTSMIGVSLPLVSRSIPALSPDRDLFVIVKCFAAGIILGTGFMHVLPDSYDMLWSDCLEEKPWHEFPFSGLVAMFSALITMMVDSLATSYYSGKGTKSGVIIPHGHGGDQEMGDVNVGHSHGHHHMHNEVKIEESATSQLLRYRVVAMVTYIFPVSL